MNIIPAREKVILRPLTKEVTADGIIIPGDQDEKARPEIGLVYAVGEGKPPVKLTIGGKLGYAKYMGSTINYRGQEFITCDFKDIQFVIEE